MANFLDGKLSKDPIAKVSDSGKFLRPDSIFRKSKISSPSPDRFKLYVSYACPWAHRTLIARNLKGLKNIIDIYVSEPYMGPEGWSFKDDEAPKLLSELYLKSDSHYSGKISVPVLWDSHDECIFNNESSEIIRIFNTEFKDLTDSQIDLYPNELKDEIDEVNDLVYERVNNGVYKAGFASSQMEYNRAYDELFDTLDILEEKLSENKFLVENYFTEADIRLFTTLFRFDPVYVGHFKCNKKRIIDYPALSNYLRAIYQIPEVKITCNLEHIKEHYYTSHPWINPSKIIPKGPELSLDSPHDRGEINFWTHYH